MEPRVQAAAVVVAVSFLQCGLECRWDDHAIAGRAVDRLAQTADPPEMEIYKLVPMFVGSAKRVVGHALTYAPSPQASIGEDYGMRSGGHGSCTGALTACHGPHIGVERFIGPDDGNLTATPMMKTWRRPFRENVGNRQGITRSIGELLTEGGMMFRGHHVWLGKAMNGAGGTAAFIGLPAYRLAGFYCTASPTQSSARPVSRRRRLRCM